jgi:hypothetical protein
MVGGLYRAIGKQFQEDLDLRQVIHLVRDQSGHIQVSAKDEYAENHSPKERRLESLLLSVEARQSE